MTDEELFQQAVNLSESQQADFLRSACGDDTARRRRLMLLLSSAGKGDDLLDTEAMSTVTSMETGVPQQLGDFTLGRLLGRGGMGVVYEAKQKSLNRTVALKLLSSGLGLSSRAILRFRREAEAAGKLHHTNIVPIYTTGEENGIHFYAMELIDGPSLDQVIRDLRPREGRDAGPSPALRGRLSQRESELQNGDDHSSISATSSFATHSNRFDDIAAMFAEVADALEHAHEHGVIHRDIKPSNLLLRPDGQLSVNDFGLARMLEQPGMTMTGEFVGSPLYMSPEQIAAGRTPIDHRTDIYSLGATLYEMLTLQPPFPGESRDQVLTGILHKEAKSTRKIDRRIPVDLDTICMKAIAKDPDKRYQTAGKLAEDLRAYVNRHAISARRIGWIGKTHKLVRRNPIVASLSTLLAGSLVLLVSNALHQQHAQKLETRLRVNQEIVGNFLRGDFQEFDRFARQLDDVDAARDQVEFAAGLAAYARSDYVGARLSFLLAAEHDESNVRARAMAAYCQWRLGDEVGYIAELNDISDDEATDFEDKLFLAFATHWADAGRSFRLTEEANTLRPNEPIIRLARGVARRTLATHVVTDKQQAWGILSQSLADIESAIDYIGSPTPLMRTHQLVVRLDRYRLLLEQQRRATTSLSDELTQSIAEKRREVEQMIASDLSNGRVPSPDLQFGIVHSLGQLERWEDLTRLADDWMESRKEIQFYAAQALSTYFLSQRDFPRALQWAEKPSGSQAVQTRFIESVVRLLNPAGETSMSELRRDLRRNLDEKLSSGRTSFLLHEVLFLNLLGQQDALESAPSDSLHAIIAGGSLLPVLEYFDKSSKIAGDRDALLTKCRTVREPNSALAHAYYVLAMESLADHRFGKAKADFEACISHREYMHFVHRFSECFLAQHEHWDQLHTQWRGGDDLADLWP